MRVMGTLEKGRDIRKKEGGKKEIKVILTQIKF